MAGTVNTQLPLPQPSGMDGMSLFRTLIGWAGSLIQQLGAYGVRLNLCLPKDGSENMTGALTLAGAPTQNLHAATKQYVDQAVGGVIAILPGTVLPYAGSTAPSGYLLCDGSSYSTSTYSSLFSVIGYTYGGSGSSFNVPDLRGRVVAGFDSGNASGRLTASSSNGVSASALGNSGGEQSHTLSVAELASHNHGSSGLTVSGSASFTGTGVQTVGEAGTGTGTGLQSANSAGLGASGSPGGGVDANGIYTPSGSVSLSGLSVGGNTASAGSGTAHNNVQPTLILVYIIKT